MKMRKIYISIFVMFLNIALNAQPKTYDFSRIGIGDEVPGDLPLVNLINYSKPSTTVSNFKGKWLILDYWFTGCGPCIQSFPKIMNLQEKYGDKIQIMLVNHMQNKAIVEEFIKGRNKSGREIFSIPSVAGDTILHKVLPPSGYPSIIWIDPDGFYRASTSGSDLNEENLKLVLNDKGSIQTLIANSSVTNLTKPLFIDGNGGSGQQMLWYSTVSKYSPKVRSGMEMMWADSSGYVVAATHKPIIDLIMRAYSEGPFGYSLVNLIRLPRTQIELRVKDPKRLLDNSVDGVVATNNLYTYQLISYEPQTIKQLKGIMKDDISKYFGLEMKWERIKKKCLVLTAEDTTLLGDGKIKAKPTYGFRDGIQFLSDVTINNLFGYLTEYIGGKDNIYSGFDGYPLVNETGFVGGLDLILSNITQGNYAEMFADYKKLNSALAKYKMQFSIQERKINVLVVMDAKVDKHLSENQREFK
ncbi:TlpA family protein disulfide reductase [Fulvivirgaceae bacterium PWU4]|uniref:TlpA family protein disulfide reductase n=1 Tax=Chryseosolibacter histidini TaxID=2782349 RepID=A0AAP2DV62_9BACT|nr:TlpA family protein disulfide reductase [Chryseosolibacter histidini]MBT1701294.1 TlpA family protein disulfide reductase [Chryseosolibacter histidini]